jgi:hypothetical protein
MEEDRKAQASRPVARFAASGPRRCFGGAAGWPRAILGLLLLTTLLPDRLGAVTLIQLLTHSNLSPKKFAAYFEDFAYEFSPEVLPAETFLRQERGDCDDYAILADYVLRRHRYQPRLIHVRMVGRVAHAVCYVTESKAYLDFNNRKYFINVERCGGSLREIATKVADSFKANWTSVSEFTYAYDEDKKYFGLTVVKTDPPASDADANPIAAPKKSP